MDAHPGGAARLRIGELYERKAHRHSPGGLDDRHALALEQRPPAIQGIAIHLRHSRILGQCHHLRAGRTKMIEPVALPLLQLLRKPMIHSISRTRVPIARRESLRRISCALPDGVRGSRTLKRCLALPPVARPCQTKLQKNPQLRGLSGFLCHQVPGRARRGITPTRLSLSAKLPCTSTY